MKENSDGNDTNVGSIGNSIEEDIKILESIIKINNDYLKGIENQTINQKEIKAIEHILSDYKRVLKENEELKKDYYNVINKIENKIDILDIAISECIYIDDDDKAYKKAVKKDKLCLLNQKRALQELLEEGDLE